MKALVRATSCGVHSCKCMLCIPFRNQARSYPSLCRSTTTTCHLPYTCEEATCRYAHLICVLASRQVHHLGFFTVERNAARMYDRAVARRRGPGAPTSRPRGEPFSSGDEREVQRNLALLGGVLDPKPGMAAAAGGTPAAAPDAGGLPGLGTGSGGRRRSTGGAAGGGGGGGRAEGRAGGGRGAACGGRAHGGGSSDEEWRPKLGSVLPKRHRCMPSNAAVPDKHILIGACAITLHSCTDQGVLHKAFEFGGKGANQVAECNIMIIAQHPDTCACNT